MNVRIKALCIVAVTALWGSWPTCGQDLISSTIEQNGEKFDFDHIFTDPSPLTFSLTDKSVTGKWEIDIQHWSGDSYIPLAIDVTEPGCCTLKPKEVCGDISQGLPINKPELNRYLFEIIVSFKTSNGIQEQRSVKLGLIPTKPEISDVKLTYASYDWDNDWLDDGWLSFTVKSQGAEYFVVHESEWHLFNDENVIYFIHMPYYTNDEVHIDLDAICWGEFLYVTAHNEFGWATSNQTIFTTSYITDPDVLARIDELGQLSSVKNPDPQKGDHQVMWKNNMLFSDTEIKRIFVYNTLGTLCAQYQNVTSADLSNLKRGIYVISYETSDNQSGKLKIIKQ